MANPRRRERSTSSSDTTDDHSQSKRLRRVTRTGIKKILSQPSINNMARDEEMQRSMLREGEGSEAEDDIYPDIIDLPVFRPQDIMTKVARRETESRRLGLEHGGDIVHMMCMVKDLMAALGDRNVTKQNEEQEIEVIGNRVHWGTNSRRISLRHANTLLADLKQALAVQRQWYLDEAAGALRMLQHSYPESFSLGTGHDGVASILRQLGYNMEPLHPRQPSTRCWTRHSWLIITVLISIGVGIALHTSILSDALQHAQARHDITLAKLADASTTLSTLSETLNLAKVRNWSINSNDVDFNLPSRGAGMNNNVAGNDDTNTGLALGFKVSVEVLERWRKDWVQTIDSLSIGSLRNRSWKPVTMWFLQGLGRQHLVDDTI